ncbi:MAG: hypothetical protein LBD48_11520 [Treponema sp.]|nr:hypothetical protein [Treponema sp.]
MTIKKWMIFIYSMILLTVFFGCGNQKKTSDNKRILANYSDDLSYNFNKAFYFMPLPVYRNFYSAFLSFDPTAEYDETILEPFAPDYVRSNIHTSYCVFLQSQKMSLVIQFPNRTIYDRYVSIMEKKPVATKYGLKKLLRFEYAVAFIDEGIELVSDNYVYIGEDALINGESRYWLYEEYYDYFLGDDFIQDMNVFTTWVTGKKWNDPNSTLIRKNGRVFIQTNENNQQP